LKENKSKRLYRIIDVDEELFEIKKRTETLAGFILEIIGNFPKRTKKYFPKLSVYRGSCRSKKVKQIK
jgi:hypothetical protein